MSFLNSSPEALTARLQDMAPREVKSLVGFVTEALDHRSHAVRWAAALALGKAGTGEEQLLTRLSKEKNELVLTEICDSLASLGSRRGVELLQPLAARHRSPLVRGYAVMATADILHKEAVPFLTERLVAERNHWVKAVLRCVIFSLGLDFALEDMLTDLSAELPEIRSLVANLLALYRPRRRRKEILTALNDALRRETDSGVERSLKHAIKALSPKRLGVAEEALLTGRTQ